MAQAWYEMSKQLPKAFSVAWQTGRKEAGDCCPLQAQEQHWPGSVWFHKSWRPITFWKPACSKG